MKKVKCLTKIRIWSSAAVNCMSVTVLTVIVISCLAWDLILDLNEVKCHVLQTLDLKIVFQRLQSESIPIPHEKLEMVKTFRAERQ